MSLKHFSAGDSVFSVACADILAFGVLSLLEVLSLLGVLSLLEVLSLLGLLSLLGGAALQRCDLRTFCERL
jgi:hypothetical protein